MDKKKILLLSDDLRMSSGVGTMSKEFVLGTLHHYDWVQLGGAIKHPEAGKVVNMNEALREETGVEDACLTIYPTDGYGSQEQVRQLLQMEQPNAILHYTDPRFWDGCTKWNMKSDKRYPYFITTFGMTGQHHIIMSFSMSVLI